MNEQTTKHGGFFALEVLPWQPWVANPDGARSGKGKRGGAFTTFHLEARTCIAVAFSGHLAAAGHENRTGDNS